MSRSNAIAVAWISLAAWTCVGLALAMNVWQDLMITIGLLDSAGWSAYLRRPPTQLGNWIVSCVLTAPCPAAFSHIWTRRFPLQLMVLWGGLAAVAVIARSYAHQKRSLSEVPPGAARWAHRRELTHLIWGEQNSPQRGYLGILAATRRQWWTSPPVLRLPERLRCSHCLVVGGSGARKTTGYHKPNVLLDACEGVSVVIFDLKYPDVRSGFWDCVPFFAARGHDVQLFLPFEQETLALPLLGEVHTLEDAYDVVDLLVPPSLQEHPSNFYRDQERQLLVGLILGIVRDRLRANSDPFAGPPSLRRLFQYCLAGIREIERYIHTHPDPQVRETVAGLFGLEDRLLAGIAAGVAGRLQIFNDDRLERATSPSADPRQQVRLAQLGTVPTLLYVGMPQERVQGARGQLVLQLVKRAVERALLQTADRHGGALPRHVSIYLDDVVAMGPLPNVSEMMATMRSRRVAYHLSLQNRAHGELLYGTTGFRSFFVNNIQTVLIFPRYLRFDDAAYFSEMLGFMTIEQRSMGLSRRGWLSGSRTDWSREALRPLLPPEEYPDWPEAMAILFTIGARPIRVLLPRLDEDRVSGIRNPLASLRRYLQATGDEVTRSTLVKELIRGHLAWVDAHQTPISAPITAHASREASDPSGLGAAVVRSQLVDDLARVASSYGENTLAQQELAPNSHAGLRNGLSPETAEPLVSSLRRWVHEVLEVGLTPGTVSAFAHTGRLTRISIHRDHLPPALAHPQSLGAWIGQRWVRATPSEIRLLPRALRLLPRQYCLTLRQAGTPIGGRSASQQEEVPRPYGHQPSDDREQTIPDRPCAVPTDAMKAMEHLHTWVIVHGQHFEGHPMRDPHFELFGVYTVGKSVTVRADKLHEVFEMATIAASARRQIRSAWRAAGWIRSDPDHLTTVKRLGGRRHRVIEIRWACWTAINGGAVSGGTSPAPEQIATGALPSPFAPVPEEVFPPHQGTRRDPQETTSEKDVRGDTGVVKA